LEEHLRNDLLVLGGTDALIQSISVTTWHLFVAVLCQVPFDHQIFCYM